MTALAPSLQAYFTQRLIGERAASPNTIASYKLTFQLLLAFAASAAKKAPSSLDIADLDAPLIASFLEHLEQDRRNSVATRNSRLAAIHSCSATLPCATPSTQARSSVSWRSRPSAPSATWSPTSATPRPARCSALVT